jgi:hypothetical protein
MNKPEGMTLQEWITLQESLANTVKDLNLMEKEAKRLIRFFSAMLRDKNKWGK